MPSEGLALSIALYRSTTRAARSSSANGEAGGGDCAGAFPRIRKQASSEAARRDRVIGRGDPTPRHLRRQVGGNEHAACATAAAGIQWRIVSDQEPPPTADTNLREQHLLRRIRLALALFMVGLVVSGVTAFPLESELNVLTRWFGVERIAGAGGAFAGVAVWVLRVRDALHATYASYPFIAYGTDWLAFGHIVIALFFVAPWLDPVKNIAAIQTGLWACVLVLPLALICGPIRGVPFFWRLIDCSFGVLGFPLLWYAERLTRQLRDRSARR